MNEAETKGFRIKREEKNLRYFDTFVSAADYARHLVRDGAAKVVVEEQSEGAWTPRETYLPGRPSPQKKPCDP